MNNDNDVSKPPTTLTLRPTMEQQEEARQLEKARRMTNDSDNNALIPTTMTTTTMTTMITSCQYLPFFIGFFIVWLIDMGYFFFGGKYGCRHKWTQIGANIINFVSASRTHLTKIGVTSCVGMTCC